MKTCLCCGESKPYEDFYKDAKGKDGFRSSCKKCVCAKTTAYKHANPGKTKEANRRWREANREHVSEYKRRTSHLYYPTRLRVSHRWRKEHPEKDKANRAVANALRSGHLIRPDSCSMCDSSGLLHAHHADYAKPLEVEWLCPLHHKYRQSQAGSTPSLYALGEKGER